MISDYDQRNFVKLFDTLDQKMYTAYILHFAISENIFENRFMFASELNRMGSDITVEGHHALIQGVEKLQGAPVSSPDLRGGAALVIAGLAAEGETVVHDIYHIDRGYEDYVGKLSALGAQVERTTL